MNWNTIRKDFTPLSKKAEGKKTIYFDNACSTLKPVGVIKAMQCYFEEYPGCGGKRASHYFGARTEQECANARKKTAEFINAKNSEVVWTKNTTESINLVAKSLKPRGQNIVCSVLDHHSLLLPFNKRCTENNMELRVVECGSECEITAEKFSEEIDKNTELVAVTHASNVAGSILPVREIIKIAHENNALVLVDGAQFAPHKAINVKKLDADFYCFSMHKMLGPSMGVLYGKEHLLKELNQFMIGGGTIRDVKYENRCFAPDYLSAPNKFEAGLQDYASIIGSGAAIEYLKDIGMKNIEKREKMLCKKMLEKITVIDSAKMIGPLNERERVATFSMILKKTASPKDIAEYLDSELPSHRIMLRAGTHCANPLHYFLGLNPSGGDGSLRASLYFYNSIEEIEFFAQELEKVLKKVK